MKTVLPEAIRIAEHYNELMRRIGGDYIEERWGSSEIQRRHYRQTELALRSALAAVPAPGHVLEVGCGPAVWTPLFLGTATQVHLFDISEEMLRKARERIAGWESGRHADKVAYTCGDFCAATIAPATYDTIVSARAFEYMSDKALFARKCFEALRPGGRLLLVTKNRGWRDLRRVQAQRRRPSGTVRESMQDDVVHWKTARTIIEGTGFRSVSVRPVIIGSYYRPFTWRAGLAAADAIHRLTYSHRMYDLLQALVESYIVVGRKESS